MRKFALAVICAGIFVSVQAQVTQLFIPSPIGIAITVGQWIITSTGKKIYYIEVAGEGATPEEARMNGFRLAVEKAIGSIISSETEVQNGRIKRDEIISYAAGYVDKFEIVSTEPSNNGTKVVMKVWVGRSALANRLLNKSEQDGRIDGHRAAVAVETTLYEKDTGDRLLRQVLNDFPRKSFNVEVQKPSVLLNMVRRPELGVPFKVRWNYDYLKSLWTVLDATADNPKAGNCYGNPRECAQIAFVRVISGSHSDKWVGWSGTAGYNDNIKMGMVITHLIRSDPAILLTVSSPQGYLQHRQCYRWPELNHDVAYRTPNEFMVNVGSQTVSVNGDVTFEGFIPVAVDVQNLRNMDQVKLEVIRGKDCPN